MALQATRRKHCDRAHPYQHKLKDGISLLGRETPDYILDEVRKRQLADRGTASLRAKLATEYGYKHADFIVKRGIKLTASRNDHSSWSCIAQTFTAKRRPASAPMPRSVITSNGDEVAASSEKAATFRAWTSPSNDGNRKPSRAPLSYVSSRKDGPVLLRPRTAEIAAVVQILCRSAQAPRPRKIKKGQRRKAAAAAAAVNAAGVNKTHAGSRDSSPSLDGGSTGPASSTAHVVFTGRRPNTAASVGTTAIRPSSAGVCRLPDKRSLALDSVKHGREGFHHGSAGVRPRPSTAPSLAQRSQERIPRAYDVRTTLVPTSGKSKVQAPESGDDAVVEKAQWGNVDGPRSTRGRQDVMTEDDGVNNLGAIDISKLTATLSHAEVSGYARANNAIVSNRNINRGTRGRVRRSPTRPYRSAGSVPVEDAQPLLGKREAYETKTSSPRQRPKTAPYRRSKSDHANTPPVLEVSGDLRIGGGGGGGGGSGGEIAPKEGSQSDNSEAVPETTNQGDDSAAHEGSSNRVEGGGDGERDRISSDPQLEKSRGKGWSFARRGKISALPTKDCLRGRYARAANKSRSACVSQTGRDLPVGHHDRKSMLAPGHRHRGQHAGRRQPTRQVPWRIRLAAAQKRRALLEARKDEAVERAARNRALKAQARAEGGYFPGEAPKSRGYYISLMSPSFKSSARNVGLQRQTTHRMWGSDGKRTRPMDAEASEAEQEISAICIQRSFRRYQQYRNWLGNRDDRQYLESIRNQPTQHRFDTSGKAETSDSGNGSNPHAPGSNNEIKNIDTCARIDEVASYRAKALHLRHCTVRTKRMIRGFIACTQARFLALQLLWGRVEGTILGERRAKRAAIESCAAVSIGQILHIRRIAVGLIKFPHRGVKLTINNGFDYVKRNSVLVTLLKKMQNSATTFALEHQSRQAAARLNPSKTGSTDITNRSKKALKGQRAAAGKPGEGGFEKVKQARSEKEECEAILREHGRKGRRLVDATVRDELLTDLLYSYRRQHVIRDNSEYLMEISRPPVVDSRAVKRMLTCPPEEMHIFSDPHNYRSRARYTRFALPFREIEGIIQDAIAHEVKTEYRNKVSEALGSLGHVPSATPFHASLSPTNTAVKTLMSQRAPSIVGHSASILDVEDAPDTPLRRDVPHTTVEISYTKTQQDVQYHLQHHHHYHHQHPGPPQRIKTAFTAAASIVGKTDDLNGESSSVAHESGTKHAANTAVSTDDLMQQQRQQNLNRSPQRRMTARGIQRTNKRLHHGSK